MQPARFTRRDPQLPTSAPGLAPQPPAATGQVHPTASSLASHSALPLQHNSGLPPRSTVSETKAAHHPCPASPGHLISSHNESVLCDPEFRNATGQVHPARSSIPNFSSRPCPPTPRCNRPGSPHSKQLSLTQRTAPATQFRPTTPKYCLRNQGGTPPLSRFAW